MGGDEDEKTNMVAEEATEMDGPLVHLKNSTIQKTTHIVSSTPPILKASVNSTLTKMDMSFASPLPIHESSPSNWKIGLSCDVIIKVAEDVDCIYVQADTEETRNISENIQKELREYSRFSVKSSTIPARGSCIAIYSDDGNLYRARITDVNGEAISIFSIDFGKSSTVSLCQIRILPNHFYGYPPCIKRISLARVERPPGALPTTVKDVLEDCLNKNAKIFVVPSKTNFTECYIIQDGEVLNDRISDCFRR